MAIYSFEGPQGTAKTTSAIALAVEEHTKNGRAIISNNHLIGVAYTHFDLQWFVDNMSGEDSSLENCVLFLDEAYQYMDSRLSASKINRLFTYFIVQTRKRGVDLYICTHHIENVDVRLRRAIDIRGACSYFPETPCTRCKGDRNFREKGGSRKETSKRCPVCKGFGEVEGIEGVTKERECSSCESRGRIVVTVEEPCAGCLGLGVTSKGTCGYCRGSGVYRGPKEVECESCEGSGFINVVECPNCKGEGSIANGVEETKEGEPCQRCLGYGESGMARVHFLKVRGRGGRRRFTMDVFAPKYWGYFNTKEKMPLQQKLITTIDTGEVL